MPTGGKPGPPRHRGRGERCRSRGARGHDPERHPQGVPGAGDLRLPSGAIDAPDRGHDRLRRERDPEVEPDQRVRLPPPGGRRDPGAGDRLHALERDRRARRGARARPGVRRGLPRVFGRISFFVNAGVRFIQEHAKLRAMARLWEQIGRERYGVTERKYLRLQYGVQVNSLGLTEQQPENNIQRITLEALAVTLGRAAQARAIQLPPGTRPWGCRGPGTSSGACGSSRSSPTRPTCSTTPTSSRARR